MASSSSRKRPRDSSNQAPEDASQSSSRKASSTGDDGSTAHQSTVASGSEEAAYIDSSSVVKPLKSELSDPNKQLWLLQFPSEVRLESLCNSPRSSASWYFVTAV
eukprot:gb/GECG01008900.1/.p1 GENE.gb/GECG01008900.1/~~gb/GECG01008900.1/.p1  ORF type:complete len:105 (+),score=17.99 gb/GECG01008900.1/:1-315(+)